MEPPDWLQGAMHHRAWSPSKTKKKIFFRANKVYSFWISMLVHLEDKKFRQKKII